MWRVWYWKNYKDRVIWTEDNYADAKAKAEDLEQAGYHIVVCCG